MCIWLTTQYFTFFSWRTLCIYIFVVFALEKSPILENDLLTTEVKSKQLNYGWASDDKPYYHNFYSSLLFQTRNIYTWPVWSLFYFQLYLPKFSLLPYTFYTLGIREYPPHIHQVFFETKLIHLVLKQSHIIYLSKKGYCIFTLVAINNVLCLLVYEYWC